MLAASLPGCHMRFTKVVICTTKWIMINKLGQQILKESTYNTASWLLEMQLPCDHVTLANTYNSARYKTWAEGTFI